MKQLLVVLSAIIVVVLIICTSVSINNYVNRNREHVYTSEEVFSNECAKKGGEVKLRQGYEDRIYIDEKKCEGAN